MLRNRKGQILEGMAVVYIAGGIIALLVGHAVVEKTTGKKLLFPGGESPCATSDDCNVMRSR